ncbi:NPCBM/NEW2 domain-containing protein [Aeoliella sp. ICT_H6.2]|uniref:NPCBM/NEW2 domain-containing protein n=1 Tax=Aeoliella straminimaris TaxID=2954799 RepID=A0A9X2FFJ0_9BACT|nr:NPCBM/NEW2 domain-containing protein [Aeoliella straminimaris]MCO6047844.1 NPCBM/NEW2 domain-containing protein [Aeoliella straminimaris]
MMRLTLLGLLLATLAAPANCAEPQELVLLDGQRAVGRPTQLKDGALTFATAAGEEQSFAAGQWFRWGHPTKPDARPALYFGEQSVLVSKTDWTGKVPMTIDDRTVTIATSAFGKVNLPRDKVRCLLLAAAKEPGSAARLLDQAATDSSDDRVWLVEGDLLAGTVVDFDGTTLHLEFSGQTLPVLASTIAAVAFAGDETPANLDAKYLVGLDDGSLIEAAGCTLTTEQLSVESLGEWTSQSPKKLVFLQSLAGGVQYLSDLDAVDFRHTPYFSGEWPLARDRSLQGSPLQVAGERYAKGLAMHSAARAVYRVPAGMTTFAADIALDDSAGQSGSVVFRIYRVSADGAEQAFESEVVRSGDAPQPVQVPLDDAAAIVLVVDYADYGDQQDHANWLDARFVP